MYGACDECGEIYKRSAFVQANVHPKCGDAFSTAMKRIYNEHYILYDDDYTRLKHEDTLKQQAENA
jgi:hypothetical protein